MTFYRWLKTLTLSYLFLTLTATAGFRLFGPDIDYLHYLGLFNHEPHLQGETKEPSFLFLRYIFSTFFNEAGFQWLLLTYAILGIGIKLYAIGRLSENWIYSIWVYLLIYFPLHDYTQIRVGVAVGIILLSLPDIVNGNRLQFFIKTGLAVTFHWSALAALPFYSLRKKPLFALILVAFFSFLAIPFQKSILLGVEYFISLSEPLSIYYRAHSGHFEDFRIFNIIFLLNITLFLCAFWLFIKGKISNKIDNLPSLFTAIHALSIFIYLFFSVLDRPVISFRLSELYFAVSVFSIPCFSRLSGRNTIIKLTLFALPLIYTWHLLFRVNIFPSL